MEAVKRPLRIAVVAGEASGDLLGGHLLEALRTRAPDMEMVGIGGPKMQAEGLHTWYPMEQLAVRGYVEVLRSLPALLKLRRELRERLLDSPPDLFIGIDAPDFNLPLEQKLRARGVRTVHYVSPSIWAWRGERIAKIRQAASRVLALFPFEVAIYEKAGVPVSYVGHPLADIIPYHADQAFAREQMRLSPRGTIFAMLPGSRQSEVRQMADLFVKTARAIQEKVPSARFLVPLLSRETHIIFEEAIYRQNAQEMAITILFGHAHMAMTAADAILVASGTATLEAALIKRPMVITYRMPALSYRIMKKKGYLPYVGLPNILAGEFMVPELLQDDATPENLAQALLNQLNDRTVRGRQELRFQAMHRLLRRDTASRAVEAVWPMLEEARRDA
jgi:lipid-A-disaccharide synthase